MTSAQKDQPVWLDFEDILIRVDEVTLFFYTSFIIKVFIFINLFIRLKQDKIWRKKLAKHIDKQVDEAN